MKNKEFNLSDEEVNSDNVPINLNKFYAEKDVKEFIKRLKQELANSIGADLKHESSIKKAFIIFEHFDDIINKLAGDKLK